MAELFSPTWVIIRYEIIDLAAYNKYSPGTKEFKDCYTTAVVEEFKGSSREATDRSKELFNQEPLELKSTIPPKVVYQYKLKK